jgi:hypothetical protein
VTLYYRAQLFLGGSEVWGSGVEVASSGDYKPLPADGTGVLYVPGPTASNVVDAAVKGFGKYYLQFETYGMLRGTRSQTYRDRPVAMVVAGPPTISGNPGAWYLGTAPVNDNCNPSDLQHPSCYYNSTQLTVTPGTGGTSPTAGSPAYWSFTDPLTGQPPTFVTTTCDDAGCSKVTIRATSQPPGCGGVDVRVTLGGVSSATFSVVVDWPSYTGRDDDDPRTVDHGLVGPPPGYLSYNTLQLVSACGQVIFNMAVHEEFPASPAACGGSINWSDPIPRSNWGSWITDEVGKFVDTVGYACDNCTPLSNIPGPYRGQPLSPQANASAALFIFAGSRDTVSLGKYFTAQPRKQVRYTDHGRDEPGTWICPGP